MVPRLASAATYFLLRTFGLHRKRIDIGPWRIVVYESRPPAPAAEPWILLPGLGATNVTFLPLIRTLRARTHLLAVEPSCHGGTRGPSLSWDVKTGRALLVELFDSGRLPSGATICGISLGGWMAISLALARPAQVGRLLLLCPGGYRDQDWERIARLVRADTPGERRAIWRALFARNPWWLPAGPWLLGLIYRSAAVRSALAGIRREDAFGDEHLAGLSCPVGLIWGAEDDLFRVEVGRRMAQALVHGRLWEIPGAAHAVQWERPREVIRAVEEFESCFPLPSRATPPPDR